MIKIPNQLRIKGNIYKLVKSIHKNPAVNILNCERLNDFYLKSGKINEYLFSELLFNIVLEVLVSARKQEKEIKSIQTGKKEVKLS